jgi:hypothetical protein
MKISIHVLNVKEKKHYFSITTHILKIEIARPPFPFPFTLFVCVCVCLVCGLVTRMRDTHRELVISSKFSVKPSKSPVKPSKSPETIHKKHKYPNCFAYNACGLVARIKGTHRSFVGWITYIRSSVPGKCTSFTNADSSTIASIDGSSLSCPGVCKMRVG